METYDPSEVAVTYGPVILSGFAEGSMVKVEYLGEGDRAISGSAGSVARVKDLDRRGRITIRLMETSPACLALNALLQAGNIAVPCSVTDVGRPRSHVSPAAFLKKQPDSDYSNEVPVQEWMIECGTLTTIG